MESTNIETLQITVLSNQASETDPHFPKNADIPMNFIGDFMLLWMHHHTIPKKIQKNGEEIIKGDIKQKTGMWEVPQGPQQSKNLVNNILAQTSKLELDQYLHTSIFRTTTASLLKVIKQAFLKIWLGLT